MDDLAGMSGERRGRTLPKIVFGAVLGTVGIAIVYSLFQGSSRVWLVPEDAKHLNNPLQPTTATLKSARATYDDKCANCHGAQGRGDGVDAKRYDPSPTNFTDARQMNGTTDGELFYKISEGKKPMPVFKAKLTEHQRWELVLLIRSFGKTGPQRALADH